MNGRQDVLSVKHSASRRQHDLVIKKGPEGPSFFYMPVASLYMRKSASSCSCMSLIIRLSSLLS